ncbi:MAG: DHH family phosphoesterase [Candidatus Melainabacteria bacterium]|nr:MAG: DHH family phosphoesterase [Candidatus Melainabacteria bacterium]
MEKVISRINKAINNNENIIIYGDFDCDGVTSTALLYKTLKELGANVDFYIPNRIEESHGLNTKALVKLLAKKKAKLIITCDCGISDIEEAKFIKSFNCDLIITDHHIAKKEIPNAYAILNPKVEGSLNENLSLNQIESLNELSGVGVAFKLALALINKYNLSNELINDLLVLVTIGTIGDVVPILNENRFFVKTGLNIITSANKGIQKLVDVHPYASSIKNITSDFVAFQVVPKINAEGRLDSINQAFKLLVSQDEDEINYAIMTLTTLNEQRQAFCNDMFIEAKK